MSDADWSILKIPGVTEVVERAARKVADKWAPLLDFDDLVQEACVILATKADEARGELAKQGLGSLHQWLWCDLTDIARSENRKRRLDISRDEILEGVEE